MTPTRVAKGDEPNLSLVKTSYGNYGIRRWE